MRWGLVPFWAKDIKVGFSNVNAKAEGIENKPVFREAFQRRLYLVLSITSTGGRSGKTGVRRPTSGCAVSLLSRRRQTNCALSSTTGCPWFWVPRFGRYGGEEPVDLRRLKDLLAPYPVEEMTCWPVSTRVGNVKNNDPSLIEPWRSPLTNGFPGQIGASSISGSGAWVL